MTYNLLSEEGLVSSTDVVDRVIELEGLEEGTSYKVEAFSQDILVGSKSFGTFIGGEKDIQIYYDLSWWDFEESILRIDYILVFCH